MNPKENYLHEFFRIFFANKQLVKRVFLVFAVITLLLPLVLKQSFDITAEVIVQSKKISQTDADTALGHETDKFVPPTLADIETESNILRSPALIRQTISQLRVEGDYAPSPGMLKRLVLEPLSHHLINPLREKVINPVRSMLGLEVDPVRDTVLDSLTQQALDDLKIVTLPGSNVISIIYSFGDPAVGTRFVQRLLDNYLQNRQSLQSNELPQAFYEQKKSQYQVRLDDLEGTRQGLLEQINSSDPREEITFRLNAINTEEQALNVYRDRLLQSQRWLDYLKTNLRAANSKSTKFEDYTFPFTFSTTVDSVAFEDREIKQLGEQLTTRVAQYRADLAIFQPGSEPMTVQREQIGRARQQFLKVVDNRIRERANDLAVISSVIDQKTKRINNYKGRIYELQQTQSKLRQLDTEIDALHKAFFTYTQRYEESRSAGLLDNDLSNARILSPPYEPTDAAFPKPLLIIPFGLLTGLLLAISLVYVREFFDHRFKHPAQISHQLGLPVLLVINSEETQRSNQHSAWFLPKLMHWVRN
ncbi:lipopolysaccharide biosynthesis protein [Pseudomonas sp. LS1212]|uniref:GumC family protein n=1 Tax=Pseudomonas sp. LS1212 TaxID=2972478 RepID=UPI00215D522A|nr:lipopolysaccharide biosynthesis protein [Pseudomonas sp. LS1212]UVJ41841.1 lipopolysaccharide biosynthesis protein [Pseudomonas sp. LS1212]